LLLEPLPVLAGSDDDSLICCSRGDRLRNHVRILDVDHLDVDLRRRGGGSICRVRSDPSGLVGGEDLRAILANHKGAVALDWPAASPAGKTGRRGGRGSSCRRIPYSACRATNSSVEGLDDQKTNDDAQQLLDDGVREVLEAELSGLDEVEDGVGRLVREDVGDVLADGGEVLGLLLQAEEPASDA
jgi:hypothetical protein